jgi:hypothetical protein
MSSLFGRVPSILLPIDTCIRIPTMDSIHRKRVPWSFFMKSPLINIVSYRGGHTAQLHVKECRQSKAKQYSAMLYWAGPYLKNRALIMIVQYTSGYRHANRLGPVFHLELLHDISHVGFHGGIADKQIGCNFFIAGTAGGMPQDLFFPNA